MATMNIDRDIRTALNNDWISWEEAGQIRSARKELRAAKRKLATMRKKIAPLEQAVSDAMKSLHGLEDKLRGPGLPFPEPEESDVSFEEGAPV